MIFICDSDQPNTVCTLPFKVIANEPGFTPREGEMITLIALPHKVAAHRLKCTETNVKRLIVSISRKLGVADRQSAIAKLAAAGYELEVREAMHG